MCYLKISQSSWWWLASWVGGYIQSIRITLAENEPIDRMTNRDSDKKTLWTFTKLPCDLEDSGAPNRSPISREIDHQLKIAPRNITPQMFDPRNHPASHPNSLSHCYHHPVHRTRRLIPPSASEDRGRWEPTNLMISTKFRWWGPQPPISNRFVLGKKLHQSGWEKRL